MMNKTKRVPVMRHPKPYRFLHWLIVIEMVILLITGLNVSENFTIGLLSRGLARSIHLVIAFTWLATITIFLYYFIISGEYQWFGLRRLGQAIDALVEKIRAFFTGEHLPEPIRYDPNKKTYIEKIYPTEVLAWWIWAAVWTLLALTGLALLFPDTFSIVNRFWHFIWPEYGKATAATRTAHFLGGILVVVVVLVHGYMVIQADMWQAIIKGIRKEPVAETE